MIASAMQADSRKAASLNDQRAAGRCMPPADPQLEHSAITDYLLSHYLNVEVSNSFADAAAGHAVDCIRINRQQPGLRGALAAPDAPPRRGPGDTVLPARWTRRAICRSGVRGRGTKDLIRQRCGLPAGVCADASASRRRYSVIVLSPLLLFSTTATSRGFAVPAARDADPAIYPSAAAARSSPG